MVEALRCWVEAFQIASRAGGNWSLTRIGELIFHPQEGLDPYLEDVSSSWILHWLICTNTDAPFFAWECMFNRWHATEFSPSQVLEVFDKEARRTTRPASVVTLRQHWEVFLHSYLPTRAGKGEDHLDSAMSVIRLIRKFGERPNANGKWEVVFTFDPARKSGIPQQLFTFFVHDWWNRHFPLERTTPLRELVMGDHSPGRLLKMHESEILQRVTELAARQPKTFQIVESTSLRQLRRLHESDGFADLKAAYLAPTFT